MANTVAVCAAGTGQDYVTGIRVAVDGQGKSSKQEKKDSKAIYMGGVGVENELTQKFASERKRAVKKILDQLEQDYEIAEDMKDSGDKIMQLDKQVKKNRSIVKDVEEQKKTLQEQYGVEPDSQEMLLLDDAGKEFAEKVSDDMREMDVEEASIWATKKALLKVHPMVDAMEEYEEIMKAARKNLIGDLFEQGKDKIDKDTEEQQERIDEEKLEALEEKIRREELEEEEAKEEENRENMQSSVFASTETMTTLSGQTIDNLQQDIKSLIQDQTFLDVDLKGLRVDKKL